MQYVEDYLEYYVEVLGVKDSQKQILESINRQCHRGIGLTDRQYVLVNDALLSALVEYKGTELTRVPLREIDRSKYIKLVSHAEMVGQDTVYLSFKANWKWIEVRFPFSKKDIVKIDELRGSIRNLEYKHQKGSHQHYFKFTAKNCVQILTVLANRNFVVDEELIEVKNQADQILANRFDYIPMLSPDNTFKNIDIDANKDFLYNVDKSIRHGYFVPYHLSTNLIEKIAYRLDTNICIDPDEHSLEEVFQAIDKLDRYPLLIPVEEHSAATQLEQAHMQVSKYVPNELQSVMFRVEKNSKEASFNSYVKNNNLNNWLDKSTKVVYINKSKLPKLLISEDIKPTSVFSFTSQRNNTHLTNYIKFNCDCIISYDKYPSLFWERNAYGKLQTYN